MDLKTGDVVQLVSGGPKMTIKGIIGDSKNSLSKTEEAMLKASGQSTGDVLCQWFSNEKLESGIFKAKMLKLIL